MKKPLLLPLALLLFNVLIFGQVPEGIPYQAVVRNTGGQIMSNAPVGIQFIIHDSSAVGSVVYVEQDTVRADQFGLITVVIGGGIAVQGSFGNINWAVNSKFLEVGLDPLGGTNYVSMGTTQFMSVPYALYAGNAPVHTTAADTLWLINGNNISCTSSGYLNIHTDSPQTVLTVNGYTQMGADAPPIRQREFTGITPAVAGDSVSLLTGIPDSSIRDIQVLVHDPAKGLLAPLLSLLNVQYSYTFRSSVFTLKTNLLNSLGVLNDPFTVLITYRQ